MFESLGHFVHHRRRWVLVVAVLLLAVAAVWGTQVFGALKGGGFDDPSSDSSRATKIIDQRIGTHDLIVLYRSPAKTVDDPGFRDAVTGTLARLPADKVVNVSSYWNSHAPSLVSHDRHSTYVAIQLRGADLQARETTYKSIKNDFAAPGLTTKRGGAVAVGSDIGSQTTKDLARAEMISMPVVLVLLMLIFGSVIAALLPLAIGVFAIFGAFTALHLISLGTDVSTFSINIVTMLGLGLAIDYSLFIVSRYREELNRGADGPAALAATMATAGRTVAFSGITVAISLAGLLFFPQMFLRSMGLGGIAVVLVDMVAALTVLPALLAVLGPRVNSLRLPLGRRRSAPAGEGFWARLAGSVMRRPVAYLVGATVLLLALGAPFLGVRFGSIDVRALPSGAESRVVSTTLDRDFAQGTLSPIDIVITGPATGSITGYESRLRGLPGVDGVTVAGTGTGVTHLAVRFGASPQSASARDLVSRILALPDPAGDEVLVGGETAQLKDLLTSIGRILPWTALFVAAVTFALLFAALGSIVLPLKALVMNALSLSAAFGVMVWGFQDGHLAGALGFTSTGTVEATQPVLILAVAFGLSMDYELFLLSRIREEWDRTGDNTAAVKAGLQRAGRIITSAALLLAVVIGAFTTSGITFVKLIGVGLLVAVVVDASLVRALLVPATMRLLGRANWWLPGPLRRLHARVAIREAG
jgi:trehalose monomycolate/heme transporter